MKIYIDSDYKCYAEAAEGLTEVETPFFDGKCREFIEGYRYIPAGQTWTRSDGRTFEGEMVTPYKDYRILASAQYDADRVEFKDMTDALNLLGVDVNG